ncbi:MAG: hypothetical protein ABWW69_03925, partial [Pyrodictiaceae archaeon]
MRRRDRRLRAISAIVGTIIFITVALILLGVFLAAMTALERTGEIVGKLVESRGESLSITACTTGWWLQEDGKLTINITVRCPTPVTITALAVRLDDYTTIYATRENGTTSIQYVTITPTGHTYTGSLRLPHSLPSPSTTNLTLTGLTANTISVSIAVAASPGVTVLAFKNYYELYPPANITWPPQARLLGYLESTAYDNTEAVTRYIEAAKTLQAYAEPQAVTPVEGVIASGNATSLNTTDGDTLVVEQGEPSLTASLTLEQNNTIYYTGFNNDVFSSGEWS